MARKTLFRKCPYCGGNLDPGERCDCREMKGRNYTAIEGAGVKIPVIDVYQYQKNAGGLSHRRQ